jgi:hypothetical protein
MRFELRSRENVEALAPDIQRVDLRWILFSVIGKDLQHVAMRMDYMASWSDESLLHRSPSEDR